MQTLSLVTRESFDEVMRLYTPTVYGIAFTRLRNAADAEDVTQDVFVRYFKADITYNNEEHRKAWLIRCALNRTNSCALSSQFRHRTENVSYDELAENEIPSENTVEELAERSDKKNAVLNAVMLLPPKYRTVIHLFYFEDMSVADIGKALGIRQSTVRAQLSRARDQLRVLLKGEVEF